MKKYYQTTKFKVSLIIAILLLCASAALLYFTITECLQECNKNQDYPKPCIHSGQSYCCIDQELPSDCGGCIEENAYCVQFLVGAAISFLLAFILAIYLCSIRKVYLKNLERSTWSGMASMATMNNSSEYTPIK